MTRTPWSPPTRWSRSHADQQGRRAPPTRRSGTAARSAGRWPTPTRRATWGPGPGAGAQFVIAGPGGSRTVEADEFFVDLFETAIGEDEILTEVRIPKFTGWGGHYEKFVRVVHQWPIVAVAAAVKVDGGTITEARVGLTNMGSTPPGPGGRGGPGGQPATEDAVRPPRRGRRRRQPAVGPERRRRLPPAPGDRPHPARRAGRSGA